MATVLLAAAVGLLLGSALGLFGGGGTRGAGVGSTGAGNGAGARTLCVMSTAEAVTVAAAITLFGLDSGAALATVVGVLIEVPVMLAVVKVVNASKGWYEAGGA